IEQISETASDIAYARAAQVPDFAQHLETKVLFLAVFPSQSPDVLTHRVKPIFIQPDEGTLVLWTHHRATIWVQSTRALMRSIPVRMSSRLSVPTDKRTKPSQECPYPIPGTTLTRSSCSSRIQNVSESSALGAIETNR